MPEALRPKGAKPRPASEASLAPLARYGGAGESGLAKVRRLVAAFLDGRSANTLKAYATSLEDFRRFLGAVDVGTAAEFLVTRTMGDANSLVLDYRAHLVKRGLASGTVNLRLAALRGLVKVARMIGVTVWTLEVPRLRDAPVRDSRGPGREGFVALMKKLEGRADAKAVRDRAILRLLYERALRCSEVQQLDIGHLDLKGSRVSILGKGRLGREWVTLPASTVEALEAWLALRGPSPGPLFVRLRFTPAAGPGRISRQGVYRLVRELGELAGVHARPHGLRHAAITAALDAGADVRAVQRFARHTNLQVTIRYDDNRQDIGGAVAGLVSVPDLSAKPKRAPADFMVTVPVVPVPVVQPATSAHHQSLRRGEASPVAKLTEAKVVEIRRRYAAGELPGGLAKEFGVNRAAVLDVVKGRSWKHLPLEPDAANAAEFRRRRAHLAKPRKGPNP